jgi:hypothetical protein
MRVHPLAGATLLSLALAATPAPALAQPPGMGAGAQGGAMPDAKQMSGVPLPAGDVAVGTFTVRVVRGSMANPLTGESVELFGGPSPKTVKTNDQGRAEFTGLTPGLRVKAVATINGERLESQEIDIPSAGGVRVALVATDPEMAKRAEEDKKLAQMPAQSGIVVLGDQTRFVFEMGDEGLNVFNIVEILNTARTPVQPQAPVVFDLPKVAQSPGILDGSTPQALLAGKRLTVSGPFAPGTTLVQFAYTVPFGSSDLTLEQKLPVALTQLSVMAQKAGDLHLLSPQMADHREMTAEGRTYIVGQGPALKAGDTITFNFTGLPSQPTWPRNLALALAVLIIGGGVYGSMRTGKAVAAEQARLKKLQAKRDRLFAELTSLEQRHRENTIDPSRYSAERRELVAALERVYAEMDEEAAA